MSDILTKRKKKKDMDNNINEDNSTSGTDKPVDTTINPSDFKMPLQAEQTLDIYLEKLQEYYMKIGEEKKDIISQKAKVLEAVLGTDRLNID